MVADKFHQRIEVVRKHLGMLKKDFAGVGNLSAQAMSHYDENHWPSAEAVALWGEKLNINLNWLLNGKGEMLLLSLDKQIDYKTSPVTARLAVVEKNMIESNTNELDRLRTIRAMVDGEIARLMRVNSVYEPDPSAGGMAMAAETPAKYGEDKPPDAKSGTDGS